MGLNEVLFGMAALFALAFAVAVVFTKHTVQAALWFVAHLGALAVMYALLDAPLIAALQVMVYAGAVMVLFLFAVMILDSNELEKLKPAGFMPLLGAGGVFALLLWSLLPLQKFLKGDDARAIAGDGIAALARVLFRDYVLAFELAGVLLFVAVVGVLVMAKRRLE